MLAGDRHEDRHPSFLLALAAVFAASFVVVLLSRFLFGFASLGIFPHVDVWLRFLLGSLIAAWPARLVLVMVGGYRVSYVATVLALLIGSIVTYYLNRLATRHFGVPTLPFLFSWSTLAGVLVSTWLLQLLARRRERVVRSEA